MVRGGVPGVLAGPSGGEVEVAVSPSLLTSTPPLPPAPPPPPGPPPPAAPAPPSTPSCPSLHEGAPSLPGEGGVFLLSPPPAGPGPPRAPPSPCATGGRGDCLAGEGPLSTAPPPPDPSFPRGTPFPPALCRCRAGGGHAPAPVLSGPRGLVSDLPFISPAGPLPPAPCTPGASPAACWRPPGELREGLDSAGEGLFFFSFFFLPTPSPRCPPPPVTAPPGDRPAPARPSPTGALQPAGPLAARGAREGFRTPPSPAPDWNGISPAPPWGPPPARAPQRPHWDSLASRAPPRLPGQSTLDRPLASVRGAARPLPHPRGSGGGLLEGAGSFLPSHPPAVLPGGTPGCFLPAGGVLRGEGEPAFRPASPPPVTAPPPTGQGCLGAPPAPSPWGAPTPPSGEGEWLGTSGVGAGVRDHSDSWEEEESEGEWERARFLASLLSLFLFFIFLFL